MTLFCQEGAVEEENANILMYAHGGVHEDDHGDVPVHEIIDNDSQETEKS